MVNKILFGAAAMLIMRSPAFASVQVLYGGEGVALPLLDVSVGARESALGEAAVAGSEGPNALYWNPAALSKSARSQVSMSYDNWLADTSQHQLSGSTALGKGVFGLGLSYARFGHFDLRDSSGSLTGESAQPFALVATFGYARNFASALSLGTAFKLTQQSLPGYSVTGFSGGFGALITAKTGYVFGFSLQNLGSAALFQTPLSFRAGVGKSHPLGPRVSLLTLAALRKTPFQDPFWSLGGELDVFQKLYLRLGYNDEWRHQGLQSESSVLGGLGFRHGPWSMDYAFVPHGILGTTHRATLNLVLGSSATSTVNPPETPSLRY